jgi:uncharacterized membrane protein YcaP (DUF421 family)
MKFNKKFMGLRNPFNFIIFVMLGSIIATAITSQQDLWPFLALIVAILMFNTFVAYLISRFPAFEKFAAGKATVLITDGKVNWVALKNSYITKTELREELQEKLNTNDFNKIEHAYMASDGSINFILKKNIKKRP